MRPPIRLLAGLLAGLLLAALPRPAAAATELQLWHSLDGPNGALVARIADDFNAAQAAYRVIPIYKGSYAETISGGIAAYRAGAGPHMLQVFEVGNGTMAAAIGAVRPVSEVMQEAGRTLEPGSFLPVIATNYLAGDGRLLSLPFNISSMVMWINRDRFRQAGLDAERLPETWPEVFAAARALRAADGAACALSTAWPTWAHIEQLSVWHDLPIATRANGLDGYDAELVFNGPLQVRHLESLVALQREGAFAYAGRSNAGEARFVAGACAIFITSSSMYGKVTSGARFDWTIRPMPYYPEVPGAPQNGILGGGSIYALRGKTQDEYAGIARFLAFVLEDRQQELLYRNTGYVPATRAAYAAAEASGFYAEHPPLRVAVDSLLRKAPTRNSAGLRLGNMLQIRDLWAEEIEAALAGRKTAREALDAAVARGNAVLRTFQQRTGR